MLLGISEKKISRYKSIIIDDDEFIRKSLRDKLEKFFPELNLVANCSNASEGLAAIRDHSPDLVFLDIEMPGMSGFEVLRALRSDASSRNTPVIVATSKNLPAADREALDTLGAAIMQKDLLAGEGAATLFRQALSRVGLLAS